MFKLWLQHFLFFVVFFLINLFIQGTNFSEAAKPDSGNQKTKKAFPVVVGEIQSLSKVEKIELPGTVIPWAITSLAAEIDSRVDNIYVNEGDFVKKGDFLIQLRTRPLELELELAKAQKKRI